MGQARRVADDVHGIVYGYIPNVDNQIIQSGILGVDAVERQGPFVTLAVIFLENMTGFVLGDVLTRHLQANAVIQVGDDADFYGMAHALRKKWPARP